MSEQQATFNLSAARLSFAEKNLVHQGLVAYWQGPISTEDNLGPHLLGVSDRPAIRIMTIAEGMVRTRIMTPGAHLDKDVPVADARKLFEGHTLSVVRGSEGVLIGTLWAKRDYVGAHAPELLAHFKVEFKPA